MLYHPQYVETNSKGAFSFFWIIELTKWSIFWRWFRQKIERLLAAKVTSVKLEIYKKPAQSPSQSAPTILVLKTWVGLWPWKKVPVPKKISGWPEGVSSTITKVEIAQDIYLQMWKDFWCEKCFAILMSQIKSKLIARLVTYILAST